MNKNNEAGCGFLLPATLEILRVGLVYYALNGTPVLCLGDHIQGAYMKLPEQVADTLRRTGTPHRLVVDDENGSFAVTYGVVQDNGGTIQGYVLTRQLVRGTRNGPGAATGSKRAAVTRDTNLSELFSKYPLLWANMGQLDEALSEIKDPRTLEMLRQATVGELAKSLGAEQDGLIAKINELISKYVDVNAVSEE
jgi:sulfur carrier protein ThiS